VRLCKTIDASEPLIIQPNSKLLMIGDSITDCGRARDVAEATGDLLGSGYVSSAASHHQPAALRPISTAKLVPRSQG
jgi:hypothetical protein